MNEWTFLLLMFHFKHLFHLDDSKSICNQGNMVKILEPYQNQKIEFDYKLLVFSKAYEFIL